jgi:hypothetical protein
VTSRNQNAEEQTRTITTTVTPGNNDNNNNNNAQSSTQAAEASSSSPNNNDASSTSSSSSATDSPTSTTDSRGSMGTNNANKGGIEVPLSAFATWAADISNKNSDDVVGTNILNGLTYKKRSPRARVVRRKNTKWLWLR